MTVNYTTNLALGQPVTGTESGTWGDDVNNAVTSYLDIAIAGGLAITVTTADVMLTLTQGTSSATNISSTTAQYAILNVSGAMTAARNLILPSSSRQYVINNNTTGGFALTVKGSATSGVTMVNGEKAHVFWNGSDYAKLSNAPGGAGSFTDLSATGNTTLGDASADTVTVNGTATFNASPVISVTDNTNAALRITQLGTGDALLVEDSTNPDASPFVITNNGSVIAGYTSRVTSVNVIEAHSASGVNSTPAIGVYSWGTLATGGGLNLYKSRSGTVGTYSLVANGTQSSVRFQFDDGAAFQQAASIIGSAEGAPALNSMPGRLTFSTTADGSVTPTERMRIDSTGATTFTGNVGIGTTSPQVKLEISGTNSQTWIVTASISGVTMDVTAVSSGTIAVGDLVFGANIQPYTRVTALGTGTGGIGTYTVSVFQTAASASVLGGANYNATLVRITDTDTSQNPGQPTGGLQFYTSDASSPTAGVGAYVAALAESTSPDTALVFGTRDNAGGGVDANERMRIDSAGNVQVQTGAVVVYQPTPASFSALATLTNANLQTQIITATGSGVAFTLTMPLGTTLETLISWSAVNLGYDFSIINTAIATVTMGANTGVTIVGADTILSGTSGRFRIRRTAANTFVLYRIS